MLVKNDLNMNNNENKLRTHQKSGKQDYQIYIIKTKSYNKTQCFHIYFIVQDITFLMIMGVKCTSIVFLQFTFFPYKSIREQIWPCHKIGQSMEALYKIWLWLASEEMFKDCGRRMTDELKSGDIIFSNIRLWEKNSALKGE